MHILITAGPTREHFDSVRFISNASSGKMGYAIATEALRRGHQATLVSGPTDLSAPSGADIVRVVSAQEMHEAVMARFDQCHAAVMSAAVCDYRPVDPKARKTPKGEVSRHVELEPTRDICAELGAIKGDRVLVGFAMEDHAHRTHAEEKLRRKQCDAIVLNHVETLASERAQIEVFLPGTGWAPPMSGTKAQIAGHLVALVEGLVEARTPSILLNPSFLPPYGAWVIPPRLMVQHHRSSTETHRNSGNGENNAVSMWSSRCFWGIGE